MRDGAAMTSTTAPQAGGDLERVPMRLFPAVQGQVAVLDLLDL
jgi:hypothetical protein